MDVTRRKLFGIGAAVAATAAIPLAANTTEEKKTVGPTLLERVCDCDKDLYSAEEIAERKRYWGCGTRFQWWLGTSCICPKCGWQYSFTIEHLKSGKYNAKSV